MKFLARGVVKHRRLVLLVATLLLIPSLIGAVFTGINYDILTYLPQDLDSMVGEVSLENDFHIAATGMVTLEGIPTSQIKKMEEQMKAVPGVRKVISVHDALDDTISPDVLPDELQNFLYGKNDSQLMLVLFDNPAASEETLSACRQLRKILRDGCFFGGLSMILSDTKDLINQEMPWYILCAVGASILVLFLSIRGWAVPPLFMLGLLFPIAYNFGSNIFLGQISYITEALATVLQLGVTMDFSIFLLGRYQEEKAACGDKEEAMIKAICNTGTAISASSLTTIAGFLALCTMKLTLGRDIGIVMAKGVALGVLCTITILPALLLCFDKLITKYEHPTIIPKLTRCSKFVTKHYKGILVAFVICFIPFAMAQSKVDVYYTLFDSLPQDLTGIVGNKKLGEDFGMENNNFILVSDTLNNRQVKALCAELEDVDGVTQVMALDKFLGGAFPSDWLPASLTENFEVAGKKLILVNSSFKTAADNMNASLDAMDEITKRYDPTASVTGEPALTKDLIEIAAVDFLNVSYSSIAAVFAIIALSFGSLALPVVLVAAIESAIYINLGIPYFTGTVLPFVASIVLGTIQLGATVDYAILMSTRFKEEIGKGLPRVEAAQVTMESCSQSILTSGLTFFAATIGVSFISRMELLQSLCTLISRGALISMFVILFVLPGLLIAMEPVIARTTRRWPRPGKAAKKEQPAKEQM